MSKIKIAITLERSVLEGLDALVADLRLSSRSQAIEEAVIEKLDRVRRSTFLLELEKLDKNEEKRIAEIAMTADVAPEIDAFAN